MEFDEGTINKEGKTMQTELLTEVPFSVDLPKLMEELRLKEGSRLADEIRAMAETACAKARPRVIYRACLIESRGEDFVVADGTHFQSRVLAVNVEKVHRLFPFVATCGQELEEWSLACEEGLKRFCAEKIKEMALRAAIFEMLTHMEEHHHPGQVSMMNPGSLEDWPLTEQQKLFNLLGAPEESVGVELLDSNLMKPGMSASGIWFPSKEHYENCMLCPMEDCPGRRAPYDRDLYDRKYKKD